MGSNSSKNLTFDQTIVNEHLKSNNILITPTQNRILEENFVDPRSPTLNNRTPVGSPAPARSWRAIKIKGNFDPRSPSIERTPGRQPLSYAIDSFDPRSPSLNRTPVGDLTNSEGVAFSKDVSSPYVAGRSISFSTNMEEAPAVEAEIIEAEATSEATVEENANRQDGASVLDTSMQLNNFNSEVTENDHSFQQTAMQSIEIVNPQNLSSENVKKESTQRKRKKDHKRDSIASSPLKRSYGASSSSLDTENLYTHALSQKQLCNTPPRSPLSTLTTQNKRGSLTSLDKPKLGMNVPSVIMG